jgi:hypothetical protein
VKICAYEHSFDKLAAAEMLFVMIRGDGEKPGNAAVRRLFMTTMRDLEKKLRKLDYHQARLYLFCNFISLMLITAYSIMMLSPTVQEVFPEGGDSRKQMQAIFVLAVVGCTAFTIYATALFFRKKSRQVGILMALGISKGKLAPILYREILFLSFLSSGFGILAGIPLVVLLWNSFRLFLADSEQMQLNMRIANLGIPLAFLAMVVGLACVTANRYLARTDILDTIKEEHKNEPVKELGRWCGPAGIIVLLAGAVGGYAAPFVSMRLFRIYASGWLNILYAPVFIGLYMILLHTVVYGWRFRPGRSGYEKRKGGSGRKSSSSLKSNLISYSMMKFQGKQTVNNMLVSTVLIAGACFAIFYLPMLTTSMTDGLKDRPYDYLYHYRADQSGLSKKEVEGLASEYGLSLKDWHEAEYVSLGMDGFTDVGGGQEGDKIIEEYWEIVAEGKFFSESSLKELTGTEVTVEPGTYLGIVDDGEENTFAMRTDCKIFTNMSTRKTIQTSFAGWAHYNMLVDSGKGYYVLNDADYAEIAEGAAGEWRGVMHVFNVDGEDDYQFADRLLRSFVASVDESCNLASFYDRVYKIALNERGKEYWGDDTAASLAAKIDLSRINDSDFRLWWEYMPKSVMLEKTDFMRTFSVFLMMFLFIFLICITAACVIGYTRCQTIALNNRYVFDDLKKLGAPPVFLKKEIRRQCCTVIRTPSVIGIIGMSGLYTMILYANDGKLSMTEVKGLGICGLVILGIAALLYAVYYGTVKSLVRELVETP